MGEEEATMRERIVEAMAEAIYKTKYPNSTSWSDWGVYAAKNPGGFDGRATSRRLASSALDAALAMLETPSEEMVTEGECWLREYDDRTDIRNDDAARFLKSMLATLRSPKI